MSDVKTGDGRTLLEGIPVIFTGVEYRPVDDSIKLTCGDCGFVIAGRLLDWHRQCRLEDEARYHAKNCKPTALDNWDGGEYARA